MSKKKPRKISKQNARRAKNALRALAEYCKITGMSVKEDMESAISDLTADLGHLCSAEGIDFWRLLVTGLNHYSHEIVCAMCEKELGAVDNCEGLEPLCRDCEKRTKLRVVS